MDLKFIWVGILCLMFIALVIVAWSYVKPNPNKVNSDDIDLMEQWLTEGLTDEQRRYLDLPDQMPEDDHEF